ncbi:hypothetical protein MJG53_007030 [Ovis ammon polii x Ovis aries]|uniref:Uncharacterized protein n=1 Tax=Ovis ammon polii x Ovis aries TaxID=2918886 RepID=A0ACB9V1Y8_9CETA|nr:hypothetical protein MJG53_007030 [Ovis ammon polii x Ovis aries]
MTPEGLRVASTEGAAATAGRKHRQQLPAGPPTNGGKISALSQGPSLYNTAGSKASPGGFLEGFCLAVTLMLLLLVLIFGAVPAEESSWESCPKTWKAFQGSCYHFCTDEPPWLKATGRCAEEGAHLVINSQAEQEFLSPKKDVTYWMGLRKQSSIDIYKWQSTSPHLHEPDISPSAKTLPESGSQNFLMKVQKDRLVAAHRVECAHLDAFLDEVMYALDRRASEINGKFWKGLSSPLAVLDNKSQKPMVN